jgi:hypothetical protein
VEEAQCAAQVSSVHQLECNVFVPVHSIRAASLASFEPECAYLARGAGKAINDDPFSRRLIPTEH